MFFQYFDMYYQSGAGNIQGSFRGGAFEGWLNCHEESAIITPSAKILRKPRDHTTFPFAAKIGPYTGPEPIAGPTYSLINPLNP
jgi:hypothetical protein